MLLQISQLLNVWYPWPFRIISSWVSQYRQQQEAARELFPLGSLRTPRRQRQRGRRETKGLMSGTMAVHVRFNSWYISLQSSAKQQREMTKFCVVWRTWTTTANFVNLYFKFIAVSQIQFRESFDSDKPSKWKLLKLGGSTTQVTGHCFINSGTSWTFTNTNLKPKSK